MALSFSKLIGSIGKLKSIERRVNLGFKVGLGVFLLLGEGNRGNFGEEFWDQQKKEEDGRFSSD